MLFRSRELRGIRELADGGLAIGALTTYRDVLDSPAAMRYRCLAEAVPDIGDVQVRNRGTVGGSIAHADPASDLPAVVLALGATVVARSSSGERTIPANEFFLSFYTTALEPNEIVTAVRGISRCRMPSGESASTTAFATAAVLAIAPASLTPFTPSGLTGDGVTVSSSSSVGSHDALGNA